MPRERYDYAIGEDGTLSHECLVSVKMWRKKAGNGSFAAYIMGRFVLIARHFSCILEALFSIAFVDLLLKT
jgi:hypothetical protein